MQRDNLQLPNSQFHLQVNAMYFKGLWASKFRPENTKKEVFYINSQDKSLVQMMRQTGSFKYRKYRLFSPLHSFEKEFVDGVFLSRYSMKFVYDSYRTRKFVKLSRHEFRIGRLSFLVRFTYVALIVCHIVAKRSSNFHLP